MLRLRKVQNQEFQTKLQALSDQLSTALDKTANQESLIRILQTEKEHINQLLVRQAFIPFSHIKDTYIAEDSLNRRGPEGNILYAKRMEELERANSEKTQLYVTLLNEVDGLRAHVRQR